MMMTAVRNVVLGSVLLLAACARVQAAPPVGVENSEQDIQRGATISNFDECVAAGNPVLRTYPGRCVTRDGKVFIDPRQSTDRGADPVGLCENRCGNGRCEEIVCMGSSCPCAESAESCPADCGESR